MGQFNFDARSVEPDQGRVGALPAAWYPVMADETEIKPTSGGDGAFLNVRYTVLDGPYKGSKCWHKFNTKNNSEKAVEIGFKQLSAFMHAINVLQIQATEQLQNIPLFVKLKLVPAELEADGVTIKYEAKNEITAFRSVNDSAAQAAYKAQGAVVAAPAKVNLPPVQTAPAAMQAATWQQPEAQQPWQQPAQAPVQAPQQQVQQFAPASTQAPQQQQQAQPQQQAQWQQPAADPNAQPSWMNQAPVQTAAAPGTTSSSPNGAQSQADHPAPNVGETLPPWMQGAKQ
jgi:hypothetical protein